MGLPSLFGDDEHTAADGPYVRVMKSRKWLYIISALVLMFGFRLYDEAGAKALLKFATIPAKVVVPALVVAGIYMLVQYIMLSAQLYVTYDIVLSDRLTFRRADEIAKMSAQVSEAKSSFDRYLHNKRSEANAMVNATREQLESFRNIQKSRVDAINQNQADRLSAGENTWLVEAFKADLDVNLKAINEAEKNLDLAIKEQNIYSDEYFYLNKDKQAFALHKAASDAASAFDRLQRQDPAGRWGYRKLEKWVDILRIVPPPIFAVGALLSLSRLGS
jgi:hypothetical protein